jgi:hypothetical protein
MIRTVVLNKWVQALCESYYKYPPEAQVDFVNMFYYSTS